MKSPKHLKLLINPIIIVDKCSQNGSSFGAVLSDNSGDLHFEEFKNHKKPSLERKTPRMKKKY